MKIVSKIKSLDDIEFNLIKDGKLKESLDNHNYVDNKELYNEFVKYNNKKNELKSKFINELLQEFNFDNLEEAEDSIEFQERLNEFKNPQMSDKIGAAIIQIATRRCGCRHYVGYTNAWKEELISNAIMTASIRCHNFDPERSDNAFAYLTQICDNAIKEQIKKEKKQLYVKYKSIEESHGFNAFLDENIEDLDFEHELDSLPADQRRKFIEEYEQSVFNKGEDTEEEEIISEHDISKFF